MTGRCFKMLQMVIIVESHAAHDMIRYFEKKELPYTHIIGKGDGAWQRYFHRSPVSREKAIFLLVVEEDTKKELFEALKNNFGLAQPAKGIAWCTPVTDVVCAEMEVEDDHCVRAGG